MNGLLVSGLGSLLVSGLGQPIPMGTGVGTGTNPGPSLPSDLAGAIQGRLEGDHDVRDGFSGGIFRDRPEGNVEGPYLVYRVPSSRSSRAMAGMTYYDTKIRFTCYSDSAASALELRDAVEAEFADKAIVHRAGKTTPAFVADRSDNEVPKTIAGRETPGGFRYQAQLDVQAYERRDRA